MNIFISYMNNISNYGGELSKQLKRLTYKGIVINVEFVKYVTNIEIGMLTTKEMPGVKVYKR